MPGYRIQRINQDIMRELSDIIREMKDPRIADAMLSIVKIDIDRELAVCKVYISSMKDYQTALDAVKVLKGASGHVRSRLASRIIMRSAPEIRFIADDSIAHSASIIEALKQLGGNADEN
jgi:ribosome-binding factor A